MTGRLIPCIGQDGEFASDQASRQAACKWLGDLLDEGKRWSEARSEIFDAGATAFQRGFMFGKDHCSQADRQLTGWSRAVSRRK